MKVTSAAPLLLLAAAALPAVPQEESKNPLAGEAAAIREGASLFRTNCALCHGLNARGGGRGPDLTSGRWIHGASDAAIFRTVTQGVPGTEMPGNQFDDSETWALVAYLRSVAAGSHAPVGGNRENGEQIYLGRGGCRQCHMVRGSGGRLGPDLTRVGAARSLEYLTDSIRNPDKELSQGLSDPNNHYGAPLEFETVTAVTRDGKRITGIAKNEDPFSLQLLDRDETLHLFLKRDLVEVVHARKSLMPAYNQQILNDTELRDLLAFLSSLRGEELK